MKKQNEIDRDALAQRIRVLDGLSADDKSALLELLNQKKYGLVWENKPENVEEELRTHIPVLEEVKERFVPSDNPDAPNHILIEGDNLQALTTLAYTHEGKIDVIYIDPPYNTGNKDFVYNDSYVDSEDSYRHSKWLSFMEKRLRIARRLLSDKGVIFISIDDNEQANLKLLCDEVFGEKNCLAQLIWKSKSGGANDSSNFGVDHEYILCYAKNVSEVNINKDKYATVTTSYNKIDKDGRRYSLDRLDKQSLGYQPTLDFPIKGPDGKTYVVEHKDSEHKKARWRWGKDTVRERYNELVFIYPYVYTKNYENLDGQKPRSILYEERFGRTRTGSTDLTKIIGTQSIFSYPKPISLVNFFCQIASQRTSLILDFFAGSGTTLHATMQLNAEDGGHRQCILVTNNENGICENVTYERNRRVIQGYTDAKGNQVDGLTDNNLRYYKVNLVDRENSSENRQKLMQTCTDLLCIKENIYNETAFGPKCVRPQFLRFFSNNNGDALLIIFIVDSRLVDYVNETVSALPDNGKRIKTYVYSENDYPYSDDFAPVASRLELVAMPAAMRNALRNVLPDPHKTPVLDVEENTAADGEINFNDLSQD